MSLVRSFWLVFALLVAACGPSGTSPTRPSTPTGGTGLRVVGSWAGSYVPVCPDSRTCGSVNAAPSGPQQLALVLNQDGQLLSGQINLSGWLPRVADVTGSVAPDGAISLLGGDSWPAAEFCQPAGGWRITAWNGRYDARSDTITGDFTFVTQKHLSSCYFDANLTVNATSLVLQRGAMTEHAFAGHWQGAQVIRSCTPVGWTFCYPSEPGEVPFDLQLAQNGNNVTGTLARLPAGSGTPLPVSGTIGADGSALVLTGSRSEPVSGGTHVVRVTGWSSRADAVGRMQGSFSYVDEVHWTSGASQGTTYSTSYDAELRFVVRVPW